MDAPTLPDGPSALAELVQAHAGVAVSAEDMEMVAEGASGRCIMRTHRCPGVIGIYWTDARADNAAFVPAARGLHRAGVAVPAVLAERALGGGCGACLVEDLGTKSLLSLREAPAAERAAAYRAALRTLHRLHHTCPDWELQPPFDAALYRWEQDYFATHFLGRHLGRPEAAGFADTAACRELAAWLGELPRMPVHRDCQSQNIILCCGEACFIDFQGMRMGRPEYDLASLLYDPYMQLPAAERDELLAYYLSLGADYVRPDALTACGLQRLMQALGAFANIGYNRGHAWYRSLIPRGAAMLAELARSVPAHSPASPLALCLDSLDISSN